MTKTTGWAIRGSSTLLINRKWQALSPRIKWAGHKPDHSPPSSGDVKDELRYASTNPLPPKYAFMVCIGTTLLLPSYVCRFQNIFLCCLTPRFQCFLSSHWPSIRFLSFMAFFIPSVQFFFGLPCALFCFGIHFNAILGKLPSAILWTWPYHVSWFCSISFIIVSSSPICCLIVTFQISWL